MDLYIGLLGFGTVGSRVAEYLTKNKETLQKGTSEKIELVSIYTRTQKKVAEKGLSDYLVNDIQQIIDNPRINCIIELMGGIEFSKEVIIKALHAKKHIITANKALLAHHGKELFQVATENNVTVGFEASCAGGIPIIKALTEGLSANNHSAIYGVMNGTCNFILTEMDRERLTFKQALEKASALGLAEADPSLDIDGFDAGHKIAILSTLAYKKEINMEDIPLTGIVNVKNKDIIFGKKLSYTMKLIAAGILNGDCISIWVHPAFLTEDHQMTHVEGSFNAISIIGDEVGHTFYYGRGAGSKPTSSAVISDLIALANNSYISIFNRISSAYQNVSPLQQAGIDEFEAPVYVRVLVQDHPGTLTKIAKVFSDNNISIARVLQEDVTHMPKEEQPHNISLAELIIITHTTKYSAILQAKSTLDTLVEIKEESSVYPIIKTPVDTI